MSHRMDTVVKWGSTLIPYRFVWSMMEEVSTIFYSSLREDILLLNGMFFVFPRQVSKIE